MTVTTPPPTGGGGSGAGTQTSAPPTNSGAGAGGSGAGAEGSGPPAGTVCAVPTGPLGGSALGLVTLGMRRTQARAAYGSGLVSRSRYQDRFCLALRVGYASPRLLNKLSPTQRTNLSGRVIWAVTSDQHYAVRGIRTGLRFAAVKRALGTGQRFKIHGTVWYLFRQRSATVLIAVRGGIVSEVGLANPQLTRTPKVASLLLRSLG